MNDGSASLPHSLADALENEIVRRDGGGRIILVEVYRGYEDGAFSTARDRLSESRRVNLVRSSKAGRTPYGVLRELLATDLPDATHGPLTDILFPAESTTQLADSFRLKASTLALELIGSREPCVAIIEEADEMDSESLNVLTFVASRSPREHFALVLGTQGNLPVPVQSSQMVRLAMPRLSRTAADAVLRETVPGITLNVRKRLIREADGIEVALRGFAAALTPAQRSGEAMLPLSLAVPPAVARLYRPALDALPREVRATLLIAALDAAPGEALGPRRGTWETSPADGALLRRAGLADTAPGKHLQLANRVVLATACFFASPNELRHAHAQLAGLYANNPLRKALHAAGASIAPHRRLAIDLAKAGMALKSQGKLGMALNFFVEAHRLCPDKIAGREFLRQASLIATEQGLLPLAAHLLDRTERADTEPQSLRFLLAKIAVAGNANGELDEIAKILELVLREDSESGPAEINESIITYIQLATLFNGATFWDSIVVHIAKWQRVLDPLTRLVIVTGLPAIYTRLQEPVAATIERTFREGSACWTQSQLAIFMVAAELGDYIGHFRSALNSTYRRACADGSNAWELNALVSIDFFQSGRWSQAEEFLEDSLRNSEDRGAGNTVCSFTAGLALIAAVRGDKEKADALCTNIEIWAAENDAPVHAVLATESRLMSAITCSDFRGARVAAERLLTDGRLPAWPHHASRSVLEVTEAFVRTGDSAGARAVATAAARSTTVNHPDRARLMVEAALAISGEDPASHFQAAFDLASPARFPFERARLELLYGEWLRRAGLPMDARRHLRNARQSFRSLGSDAWAERAGRQLRATGTSLEEVESSTLRTGPIELKAARLTAMEETVARFAASGLSNKQIATQMFLSSRTVSGYLYKVFPKLRVATRAGLRDALLAYDGL